MDELIGFECELVFSLEPMDWPIKGYPAWVVIDAVDMPMIKMRSVHAGLPLWVNASIIKTVRSTGRPHKD